MALNEFCVDCVDDYCAESVLPPLAAVCEVMNDEGFDEIFVTDQGHPITGDPTLIASWTPRLNNTSDGTGTGSNVAHPIRHFEIVDGERPAPTLNFKKNRRGTQSKLQKSTRSITWIDDDDSDAKYAMYTAYQCNGNVLAYPKSGKHQYGGKAGAGNGYGIAATIKPVYSVAPGSTDGGAHRWTVTLEWDAKCEEDRFVSPF